MYLRSVRLSDEMERLRAALIAKIIEYADEHGLKAYQLAKLAGVSEAAVRDFKSDGWRANLDTLQALERIIPLGWAPSGRGAGDRKSGLRTVDLDARIVAEGGAGALSTAFSMARHRGFVFDEELMALLRRHGVMEYATLLRRDDLGEFRIEEQGGGVRLFGRSFSPIGTRISDKPDRAYARLVQARLERCWEAGAPLLQHVQGPVKGTRFVDSWLLQLPLTVGREGGAGGEGRVLSVALPAWQRHRLRL